MINPEDYKLSMIIGGRVAFFDKRNEDNDIDWVQLQRSGDGKYIASWFNRKHRGVILLSQNIADVFGVMLFPEKL